MNMSTGTFHAGFTHQFKLNFWETENVAIGHSVSSEVISAGGHLWRIICYPRGEEKQECYVVFLCIVLRHESQSKGVVKAIFEAFLMDKDGANPSSYRMPHALEKSGTKVSWDSCYVSRDFLKCYHVTNDGSFIIRCSVKVVLDDDPFEVPLPPSDIGTHLGLLLDSAEGSDVSFVVDGDQFPAHRAVLAACSPVFKAQLLGSMADAKMPSMTLHDIAPAATFRVMLRFIYTDACPEEAELGGPPHEMFQDLLAAADRFALDRLKIMCAKKLQDKIAVDTVGSTLMCAETYNCPQLKNKCIEFFREEKNFRKAVLSYGFAQLVLKFPSILDELREKVGA